MGSDCCQSKGNELSLLRERQSKVLWIVLVINAFMFVVELNAGLRAQSLSLTGDSLDMLGDALVYGSTLFVLYKSEKLQAGAAFLKGIIMLASSLAVFVKVVHQFLAWQIPEVAIMGRIGLLALFSNLFCVLLLSSHKDDNINMKSVWLCSRNDIVANGSVLIAALFVLAFRSPIPDLIVGFLLAVLFAKTSLMVLGESWSAMLISPP